jgi:hypothetical protein
MRALAAWIVAVMALAAGGPALAVEPERREVVVVSARVWDGYEYKETFVPSDRNTLTLLSGADSAISFVRTQEYYWPLSRRVYVDFEGQREALEGVLRIEADGEILSEAAAAPFSIVYPNGVVNGNGRLLWGPDAEAAYAAHLDEERAFSRRLVEAQRAATAYERRLLEAGARRTAGGPAETIPPPPPPPEPSLRLVTRPVVGHRIDLPAGRYTLSLWKDGAELPGTRRTLRVFDGSGRATLVADVVPEERWTRPLAADTQASRIFAKPGSVFYVTLAEATVFDEAEYLPVVSPQADVVAGRSLFVRRRPATPAALLADWDGTATSLALERLMVEQTRGSGFGYRVRAAAGGETADLTAFPVAVPSDPSARRGTITSEDGDFVREIVVVQPRHPVAGLLLALTPCVAGLALWTRRRHRRGSARLTAGRT